MTDREEEDKIEKILFKPKAGKLKQIYPELSENKKFKDLLSDDMLFVWLYACASSPINPDLTDTMRARTATSEAIKDPDKRKRYNDLDFPDRVKEAIEEMKKFNPDVRMIAKRITQNNFRTLERMSQTKPEDFESVDENGNKVIDRTGQKQFVDMVAKTADILPTLIAQMEQGFGIVDAKGEKTETEKSIDKFHSNKND